MKFTDVCLITEDVQAMTRFYETIVQAAASGDESHAYIETRGTGLAIYSKEAAARDMGIDCVDEQGAGKLTFGFEVGDVDAEYERLRALGVAGISEPVTLPWGARSFHCCDPDGNRISIRSWLWVYG